MTGQTISHYRILEKLGEGGMGVVYKAEDTKLRRTVALKFLPPHAAENRERFLREAQAAAALNHPNICTVHEIDEEHGFLTMELIEGQSVRDKIAERPLPLEEALDIAMQVCQGLQSAHEKGIVHRDIKPANLMLTAQDQVKIMDFGLAQVGDRTRITKTGSSLGTPAYMSPEQAQVQIVDRRTDIWSLGVVLYEMIAGRTPFCGDSESALAYGIVHTEPEPLTALRTGLPRDLDRIAAKALAKSPGERYQHIEDLLVDLRQLRSAPQRATPSSFTRRTAVISGGAAAVAGAGYWLKTTLVPEPPQAAVSVVIAIPEGAATADAGRLLGPPVVAPDGSAVAVSLTAGGTSYLFIRRLDVNRLARLEGTAGASYPFWSPDSRQIGFFAGGKLKRMPAAGGASAVICDAPENRGGSWSRRGDVIFGINTRGLFRVSDAGGAPSEITQLDKAAGENSHRYPVFHPDGNRFLYFARTDNLERRGVYLESLDHKTPRRRIVVADGQFAVAPDPYSKRHYLLSQQAGRIAAQRFDTASGQLIDEPRVLVEVAGQVSTSDTGVLVMRSEQRDLCRLVWVDRAGVEAGSIGELTDYWQVELSPDDRYAAAVKHDYLSGQFVVWLAALPGGPLDPLSSSNFASTPVWLPDGSAVYYFNFRTSSILRRVVNPRGPEESVLKVPDGESWSLRDISPNGRHLAADRFRGREAPIAGWTNIAQFEWHAIGSGPAIEATPRFSPDGRWLAFTSNQTGAEEIYVTDFPNGAYRHRVSPTGGSEPRWSADGRELFYVSSDGRMMAAGITPGAQFRTSSPTPLFRASLRRGTEGPRYDVTRDGQRFLLITGQETANSGNIDMILHWPSLLR